jgi:hypothetical protein
MLIRSLSFKPTEKAPVLQTSGVGILLGREMRRESESAPEREVPVVYGSCRMPKSAFPASRLDLPRALFLIAINAPDQRPAAWHLAGMDRTLLYEDDVLDIGDDWVASFSFELEVSATTGDPFLLHVSLLEHVSDFLWVA